MGLTWTIGPPGSGKTRTAVVWARAAAAAGRRVRWVALPTQRAAVLRRLVAAGPLLGVEVVTFQQLAHAVATAAGVRQPQIVGTARLALVAEALLASGGRVPTPGEAGLFAAAIAEAKRFGLTASDVARFAEGGSRGVAGVAGEIERLVATYATYETLKGAQLDDDDVRREARAHTEATPPDALPRLLGAAALVVDGLREIAPRDLAWLRSMATTLDVHVTVALEPPPAALADGDEVHRLSARSVDVTAWRFPNTVAEVRGVLRALARDLAEGIDPRDLAVVAPPGAARALRALAPEFGVALSDEAPRALVDTLVGRRLADLLSLPDQPTAARLLAVPELAAVGRRALAERLAGPDAVARLAREEGCEDTWSRWRAALMPGPDLLAWARQVVALAGDLAGGSEAERARAQEAALRRAQEAARLARAVAASGGSGADGVVAGAAAGPAADTTSSAAAVGPPGARSMAAPHATVDAVAAAPDDGGFRAWWLALLRAATLRERPRPGVALLAPTAASGRRVRRAYLVGAVAGAYDVGEREDYFVPEDARVAWDALLRPRVGGAPDGGARARTPEGAGAAADGGALPWRFRGLDPHVRAELRALADHVVVTHADGDRAGPLTPDAELLGAPRGAPAPELPTASPLEAAEGAPFQAVFDLMDAGPASVETLRLAERCAFRAWAAPLGQPTAPEGWAGRARRALTAVPNLDRGRLAALAAEHPALAPWLAHHADALLALSYGVRLGAPDDPDARIDAVARDDDRVRLVRFTLPDEDPREVARPDRRWTELWAAELLRRRYPRQAAHVAVVAWPLGGDPIELTPAAAGADAPDWRQRRARVRDQVDAAWTRWRAEPPRPAPGRHCRDCPVRDLCRPSQLRPDDGGPA